MSAQIVLGAKVGHRRQVVVLCQGAVGAGAPRRSGPGMNRRHVLGCQAAAAAGLDAQRSGMDGHEERPTEA